MGKRQHRPSRGADQATVVNALNMAVGYHQAGQLQQAAAIYHQVLDANARHPDALHLLGLVEYQQGRLEQALDLMSKSLSVNAKNPTVHYNIAKVYRDLSRLGEAAKHYKKALKLNPDAETHFNLGNLYKLRQDWAMAAEQYRAALELAPTDARAHTALGHMLSNMGDVDGAVAAFEAAIGHAPTLAEAHFGLAETLEKTHRTDALREAVTRAERDCPGHPMIRIARAWVLKRDKNFKEACAQLQSVDKAGAPPKIAAMIDYMLGGFYDRLDEPSAAFAHFVQANQTLRATLPGQDVDPARYTNLLAKYESYFTSENIAQWQDFSPSDAHGDPVFLLGFPRSGTTLIDTILRSHPALAVLEEVDAVNHAYAAFDGRQGGGLSTPEALKQTKNVKAFRKAYFQYANSHLEPRDRDKQLVDKQPLNTAQAGAIARAFPKAKIVLALRHPCDCVLSCFMQSFGFNDAMANFLDLKDAANLYDQVFALWTQYTKNLDMNVHMIRYEDVVADLEGQIRPLLDFLGVPWDDAVLDYAQTAQSRTRVNTASYDQVTEKLYTRASGRWERYRSEMAPVLDTLAPWAEKFGYDL